MFLFDVLTLGASCFTEGLKDILEDESILKVVLQQTTISNFADFSK